MLKINIEVSARHIHLSQKDVEKLFGRGYELKKLRDLSQKGEFAVKDKVTVESAGGRIDDVRILGPVRPRTQVEISLTDAYKLKINPPIRLSDDLAGSAGIKVIGPKSSLNLRKGVIVAKRHIHASLADGKKYKIKNNQKVSVLINKGERKLRFDEVVVRVDKDYSLACHIDTDEGNAAGIVKSVKGVIITK